MCYYGGRGAFDVHVCATMRAGGGGRHLMMYVLLGGQLGAFDIMCYLDGSLTYM